MGQIRVENGASYTENASKNERRNHAKKRRPRTGCALSEKGKRNESVAAARCSNSRLLVSPFCCTSDIQARRSVTLPHVCPIRPYLRTAALPFRRRASGFFRYRAELRRHRSNSRLHVPPFCCTSDIQARRSVTLPHVHLIRPYIRTAALPFRRLASENFPTPREAVLSRRAGTAAFFR